MTLLTTEAFLVLAGAVVLAVGLQQVCREPARAVWSRAAFWVVLAVLLLAGPWLPASVVGYGVLTLGLLAAFGRRGPVQPIGRARPERRADADRLRSRLLLPVLVVPTVAIAAGLLLPHLQDPAGRWQLVRGREVSQVGIGLGACLALLLARRWTRSRWSDALAEGGRLLDLLGWTLLLPTVLAALGGVLARAGVGEVIAGYVAAVVPVHRPLVAVLAYCGGMAAFTVLLGNAFAAFPVLTLGVGLPFVVRQHGGDPAVLGALGMLSGYCGTLLTPMAANFNLVPVKLLELRDDFAVIRAQAPMAAALWSFNALLMYAFVYPR